MTEPATADAPLDAARLYDRVPCGLLTLDARGRILQVNATFCAWTHLSADDLLGTLFMDLLAPGPRLFYETRVEPLLALQGTVTEVALSLRTPRSDALPVLLNAAVDRLDGSELTHVAVFDASRRQDYERQLLAARRNAEGSEARTRVLQNASTVFGDSQSAEDLAEALAAGARDGLGATSAAVFLTDREPPLAGGSIPLEAVLPGGLPAAAFASRSMLTWSTQDPQGDAATLAALRAARVEFLLTAPLIHAGTTIGVLACCFARRPDLDEHARELAASLCRQAAQTLARLQLQRQLAAIALHDPLTGLANRVLLRSHLATSVQQSMAGDSPLALIFVDLDDFKSVNDDLDHAAGDAVLRIVADRLRSAVRADDFVCRYGGDEFIIVCRGADDAEAALIAERVRLAVREPIEGDGWRRSITASVGATVHSPARARLLDAADLLRSADRAMYRAKDRGKDQVSTAP